MSTEKLLFYIAAIFGAAVVGSIAEHFGVNLWMCYFLVIIICLVVAERIE